MSTFTYDLDSFSDLHKEAYGFRPRQGQWELWNSMTPPQLQVEWDWLCKASEQSAKEYYEAQTRARVELDKVLAVYAANGIIGERAIEALHDANETRGDDEYLDYHYGVRYGTIKSLRAP